MVKTKHLEQKIKFKTPLHAATSLLIGLGIIESETEVAETMGIDKSNFSAYRNGKKTYSDNFVVKFKAAYGLELKDFDIERYNPLAYLKKESDTYEVSDYDLLATMKKQVDELKVNFDKLTAAPPGRSPKTPKQNQVFENIVEGSKKITDKR